MAITAGTPGLFDNIAPGDPTTFSFTVPAGRTMLLVMVGARVGLDPSTWTVLHGTDALTLAVGGVQGAGTSGIFYRVSPTAQTADISVGCGGIPSNISIVAVALAGTATVSPIEATDTDIADNPTTSVTTTTAGCWIVECMYARGTNVTLTHGSETGRTEWPTPWKVEFAGNEGAIGGTKFEDRAAGTYSAAWTTTNETTGHVHASMAAIKPAAAAGRASKNTRATNLGMELGMKLWMPD